MPEIDETAQLDEQIEGTPVQPDDSTPETPETVPEESAEFWRSRYENAQQVIGQQGRELGIYRGDLPADEVDLLKRAARDPELLQQIRQSRSAPAQPAAQPAVNPEQAERERTVQRVMPHFQRHYSLLHQTIGLPEEQAKEMAWQQALADDQAIRATAQEIVNSQLTPFQQLINQSLAPSFFSREADGFLQQNGRQDVSGAEVAAILQARIPVSPNDWGNVPGNLRQALLEMAADAAYAAKVRSGKATGTQVPQVPAPGVTIPTQRSAAAVDPAVSELAKQYKQTLGDAITDEQAVTYAKRYLKK
jgi:hypothetical protein